LLHTMGSPFPIKSSTTDDSGIENAAKSKSFASSCVEQFNPSHSEMINWFRRVSPEECEGMTAMQLDYRFDSNDFRTEWSTHAEALGFAREDYYHYRLPKKFDRFYGDVTNSDPRADSVQTRDVMIHTAKSLCLKLNSLAIPQGRSIFDRISDGNLNINIVVAECESAKVNDDVRKECIDAQWAAIREQLIFRKFHATITDECQSRSINQSEKDRKIGTKEQSQSSTVQQNALSSSARGRKRKLWSSADAGAELFFHKGKRGNGNLSERGLSGSDNATESQKRGTISANYPTVINTECTSTQRLSEIAFAREQSFIELSFEDWKLLLSTNHSLLLYGVGSKKNLLNSFANHDIEGDVVEIDGLDNSLSVDGILQLLIDQWLDRQDPTVREKHLFRVQFMKNDGIDRIHNAERIAPFFPSRGDFHVVQRAVAVAKRISRQVMRTSRPITLIVHNIDGVSLCNDVAQEVLAALVSQSRTNCGLNAIRLVASVDHINGQIFTESYSRHRLNWTYKQVHTHRPYVSEVLQDQDALENHAFVKSLSETGEEKIPRDALAEESNLLIEYESIFSVLKSLASTHAESLRQLAWLQLQSNQEWVNYTDLLKQCRTARIVQADQQLRLYLGELLDHNILERNKNKTATSSLSYRIPYSDEVLNLIWNFKSDQ